MPFFSFKRIEGFAFHAALPLRQQRRRCFATASQAVLDFLPKRKLLSVTGPDAAPLLQNLISQDVLRFAPLLGSSTIAALGPSGPLTRLQVKDTRRKGEEAAALSFPPPPHSFHVLSSSSSSSGGFQQLRLWRRPAIAAALLNAKCKVLADTLLVWRDTLGGVHRFLLDVEASVLERILVYLERHAVSSKVTVGVESAFAAFQLLPPLQAGLSIHGRPPSLRDPIRGEFSPVGTSEDHLRQTFEFARHGTDGPAFFRSVDLPRDPELGLSAEPAETTPEDAARAEGQAWTEGFIAADPRTWRLGYRVYLEQSQQEHGGTSPEILVSDPQPIKNTVAPSKTSAPAPAPATAAGALQPGRCYEMYRHLAGVCEGPQEVGVGDQMPLSLNFELLQLACSHNKGCFVGQEVLTRALHQLSNRRRVALLLRAPPPPREAPTEAFSSTRPDDPLTASIGSGVTPKAVAQWERALSAAVKRLLGASAVDQQKNTESQEGKSVQPTVAVGDRVYRQVSAASEGGAQEWRETGVVLAYDEDVGSGLCLIRSRPGEGPLKTPQDMAQFVAALAGLPVKIFKDKPTKGSPNETPEEKDTGRGFVVVPPPYILDMLTAGSPTAEQEKIIAV